MNKTKLITAVADMKIKNIGLRRECIDGNAELARLELVNLDFESRTALDKQRMELGLKVPEYQRLTEHVNKIQAEANWMDGLISYIQMIIAKPEFDDNIADAIYNSLLEHGLIVNKRVYSLLKLYADENINVFIDGVEASRRKSSRKSRLFSVVDDVETNYTINGDLESEDGKFVVVDDEGVERTISFELSKDA